MNDLQVFNNELFGEVRTTIIDGEVWFVLADVCKALGIKNATDVAKRLDEDEVTRFNLGSLSGVSNLVNESGLYKVLFRSDKEEAKIFTKWVTKGILPQIRKTGTFTMKTEPKELEVREQEVKLKTAELLLKIADNVDIPEYKQIINAHSTKIITGDFLLPLPTVEKKTYSAGEIGNILGISANKVGRIANNNNLKIDEYGKLVWDKSRSSAKQVDTFRYYENVIPVFQELLEAN